jgi:hypothetical protein
MALKDLPTLQLRTELLHIAPDKAETVGLSIDAQY